MYNFVSPIVVRDAGTRKQASAPPPSSTPPRFLKKKNVNWKKKKINQIKH
jgi:hypothetical protein